MSKKSVLPKTSERIAASMRKMENAVSKAGKSASNAAVKINDLGENAIKSRKLENRG